MNCDSIDRPAAPEKKVSTSESFELCYLRHQYFRRTKFNPTEADMKPYMGIVEHFTKNTFFTYQNLFRAVGMYQEDILNIGRVHLVSFLGLYALERSEEKKAAFAVVFSTKNFKEPEEKDFDQKNKANFTMFFKQRMEDVVRVCRQKVRNIKGQPSEEFVVFCGPTKPPKFPNLLIKDHAVLGYKKLDFAVFKSVRKKADVNYDATIFEFGGTWYVAIAVDQRALSIDDIVSSGSDPYQNYHNKQPDNLYGEKEFESFSDLFHGKPQHKKVKVIRKFIAKNRNSCQYKEEIATARKMLKELGA